MAILRKTDLTPDELIKHDANLRELSDTSGSGSLNNPFVEKVNVARKGLERMLIFKQCQHLSNKKRSSN